MWSNNAFAMVICFNPLSRAPLSFKGQVYVHRATIGPTVELCADAAWPRPPTHQRRDHVWAIHSTDRSLCIVQHNGRNTLWILSPLLDSWRQILNVAFWFTCFYQPKCNFVFVCVRLLVGCAFTGGCDSLAVLHVITCDCVVDNHGWTVGLVVSLL